MTSRLRKFTALLLVHLAVSCVSVVSLTLYSTEILKHDLKVFLKQVHGGGVASKYMDSDNADFEAKPSAGMSAAWIALVLTNLCAFLLTGTIWLSIATKRSLREHPDFIVIGSYSFGEFLLEAGCGLQCLLNVVAQRFFGKSTACLVEALFHAWAMISLQMLLVLVGSAKFARRLCLAVFAFSALALCVLVLATPTGGSGSTKIWLMDSGVYCFVSFASLTSRVILYLYLIMTYQFYLLNLNRHSVPITVISVVSIILLYVDIDRRARASHEIAGGTPGRASNTRTSTAHQSSGQQQAQTTEESPVSCWKSLLQFGGTTNVDSVDVSVSNNDSTTHGSSLRHKLRRRLAGTLSRSRIRMTVVVAVFMICFLPLVGAFLWSSFTGERPSGAVDVWFGLSLHLHGTLSSIFMLMWHPQLRKAAKDLLPQCLVRRDTLSPRQFSKRAMSRKLNTSIAMAKLGPNCTLTQTAIDEEDSTGASSVCEDYWPPSPAVSDVKLDPEEADRSRTLQINIQVTSDQE